MRSPSRRAIRAAESEIPFGSRQPRNHVAVDSTRQCISPDRLCQSMMYLPIESDAILVHRLSNARRDGILAKSLRMHGRAWIDCECR